MNRSVLVADFASASKSGFLIVAAIALLMAPVARAALVASFSDSANGGTIGTYGIVSSANFSLNYDVNVFGPNASLSTPRALTSADVGQSFDMTGPDPSVFLGLLTDGVDETLNSEIDVGLATATSNNIQESEWFTGNNNLTGPDLVGFDISRVELVLNGITFDSPGSNPGGDGNWTDVTYGVTYNFYSVPEPASLSLLALGGLGLMGRRRRRIISPADSTV